MYQEEIANYPRDAVAHLCLAGVYSSEGLWGKAAEIAAGAVRLAPDWLGAYDGLANYDIDTQQPNATDHRTGACAET